MAQLALQNLDFDHLRKKVHLGAFQRQLRPRRVDGGTRQVARSAPVHLAGSQLPLRVLGRYICRAPKATVLDTLDTTPATRLGSGGTTLIAPTSAAIQVATTRSSTLLYARRAFLSIPLGSLGTVAVRGKA